MEWLFWPLVAAPFAAAGWEWWRGRRRRRRPVVMMARPLTRYERAQLRRRAHGGRW